MNAYWPHSLLSAYAIAGLLGLVLIFGYCINQRTQLWAMVVFSFVLAHFICLKEPGGFRMFAMCGVVFYALKGVVRYESQQNENTQLNLLQWIGFSVFWPGMNPALFQHWKPQMTRQEEIDQSVLRHGVSCFVGGICLIILAILLWPVTHSYILITLLLLTGLSLSIHFGLFDLLTVAWQSQGVACTPLFLSPLLSTSLHEFWGQRWNMAFSEMTRLAVYLPLSKKVSANSAAMCAFIFSGLLHELAISFSVMAGFGMPSLYFLLHGLLMMLERYLYRNGKAINKHPWLGRVWTIVWLILPVPLLFHQPFLAGVVWPIVEAMP